MAADRLAPPGGGPVRRVIVRQAEEEFSGFADQFLDPARVLRPHPGELDVEAVLPSWADVQLHSAVRVHAPADDLDGALGDALLFLVAEVFGPDAVEKFAAALQVQPERDVRLPFHALRAVRIAQRHALRMDRDHRKHSQGNHKRELEVQSWKYLSHPESGAFRVEPSGLFHYAPPQSGTEVRNWEIRTV